MGRRRLDDYADRIRLFGVVQIGIAAPSLTWDYHRGDFSTARFAGAMLVLFLLSITFRVVFSRSRRSALNELGELRKFRDVT